MGCEWLKMQVQEEDIRRMIVTKSSLRAFYREVYDQYKACISKIPVGGAVIELGAGLGFSTEIDSRIIRSDIKPYHGLDIVFDALAMPFKKHSVSAFLMQNVLHHIRDAEKFFAQIDHCLCSGGRVLIFDQYPGIFAGIVLKYFHHEYYDEKAPDWTIQSRDPLIDANGAMSYIVFKRDRETFKEKFPDLKIERMEGFDVFTYWLSGGLKEWSLLPRSLYDLSRTFDRVLLSLSPRTASSVVIELVKQGK